MVFTDHTYQIVFILKRIVQRSNPLTVSIHQNISLFSETSGLIVEWEKLIIKIVLHISEKKWIQAHTFIFIYNF